ncbi:unnamed protein product [Lathyrus oleraceus]
MFFSITNIELTSPPLSAPELRFAQNTVPENHIPTCPVFAPTPNLDFDSATEDGFDYDPLLALMKQKLVHDF